MTTPRNPLPAASQSGEQLRHKVLRAIDAIDRVQNHLDAAELTPISCAFIDVKLAKAIGYLASARAVAITVGSLGSASFDDGSVWDMDDENVLATAADFADFQGGGP